MLLTKGLSSKSVRKKKVQLYVASCTVAMCVSVCVSYRYLVLRLQYKTRVFQLFRLSLTPSCMSKQFQTP